MNKYATISSSSKLHLPDMQHWFEVRTRRDTLFYSYMEDYIYDQFASLLGIERYQVTWYTAKTIPSEIAIDIITVGLLSLHRAVSNEWRYRYDNSDNWFKKLLLATGDKPVAYISEAHLFGIGHVAAHNNRAVQDERHWNGLNWYGQAITRARDLLKNGNEQRYYEVAATVVVQNYREYVKRQRQ